MEKTFAIIEIGSNNTKTHIYQDGQLLFESNATIEFKKNYSKEDGLNSSDIEKLYEVIKTAKKYTQNVFVFGTSIFRKLEKVELDEINENLKAMFSVKIEVVSQEDEARLTAIGCYDGINYDGDICVFIGGGGSIELIFVSGGKVVDKKYFGFGVVDVTNKFESLKDDIPTCTFDEVYNHVDELVGNVEFKADVLILAGGDHLYWYNNAGYKLLENSLYNHDKQKFMITTQMSDNYDRDALGTSLDIVRQKSDNPKWFDCSRAMKVITNLISHKVDSKYIIPTKINMEDGLKNDIEKKLNV